MAQKYYAGFESLALGAVFSDFTAITGPWAVVSKATAGSKAYGLTGGDGLLVRLNALAAQADMAVQLSQVLSSTAGNVSVAARMAADGSAFYMANAQYNATNHTINLSLYAYYGGQYHSLVAPTDTGIAVADGGFASVKIEVQGTTVRARAWLQGTTEPTTWPVSAPDANVTGAAYAGARSGDPGTTGAPAFDEFYVGDPGQAFVPPQTLLSVTDAKVYKSPCNWRIQGSGLRTNCSGAELSIRVTGTTTLSLTCDMASATPEPLRWSVNGGAYQTAAMATSVALASGLTQGGTYEARVWIPWMSQSGDRWTSGATQVFDPISFVADNGATFLAHTRSSNYALIYADSIGEYQDAMAQYGFALAESLELNVALRSFSGTGLGTNNDMGSASNVGDVPPLAQAYARLDATANIDVSVPPQVVVVVMGVNDSLAGSSNATTQAAVTTVRTGLRTMFGASVPIVFVVPLGGFSRAAIAAAVSATADANLHLGDDAVDLDWMEGTPTRLYLSTDGYHPLPATGAKIASAKLGRRVAKALAPSATTGGPFAIAL